MRPGIPGAARGFSRGRPPGAPRVTYVVTHGGTGGTTPGIPPIDPAVSRVYPGSTPGVHPGKTHGRPPENGGVPRGYTWGSNIGCERGPRGIRGVCSHGDGPEYAHVLAPAGNGSMVPYLQQPCMIGFPPYTCRSVGTPSLRHTCRWWVHRI